MRYVMLIFLACSVALAVLVCVQTSPPVPYPDGRMLAAPMPAAAAAAPESPLPEALPPGPAPALLASRSAPARLQIEGQPALRPLQGPAPRLRLNDPADWGIPRESQPGRLPVAVAAVARPFSPEPPPRAVAAASAPLLPTPVTDSPHSEPNLYLPEGAVDESGALLTLIKDELSVHEAPTLSSPAAPFALAEGDQVRPLTRLRSEKDFDWIKIRRDGHDWWAQAEYFIRVDPRNRTTSGTGNLAVGQEIVDRSSALPALYIPDDLVEVSRDLLMDPREIRLRREAADSCLRMAEAAAKEGLSLRVFSGFRDFDYQKKLYLEAVDRKGPKQNGVAAPGYSEHQLGTTIDIAGTDRRYVLKGSFAETPEGRWLSANSQRFGWRNSYTQENTEESGYKPEPWHLRYVGTSAAPTPPAALASSR